jgi:DNA-binding NarL/FixJ family response regulator
VSSATFRVLIAVGDRLTGDALGAALKAAGFSVVAVVHDAASAVERIEAEAPDVAVVAVDLLRLGRSGAYEPLIRGADSRLLLLSFGERSADVTLARRVGASGFLSKSATLEQLVDAIRALAARHSYAPADVPDSELDRAPSQARGAHKGIHALTEREREVLKLTAEGMSAREIAVACHISVRTVESHRQNMMTKLEVRKVSDLVRIAIRHGIVEA